MKNKNKDKNKDNIISFPSNVSKLERQIEAILFAADESLDIETIEKRVQTNSNITKILEKIKDNYKNRGINLVCVKNRWSFRTAVDLSKLMSLQKSTQKKLSKATIETLAIIVYQLHLFCQQVLPNQALIKFLEYLLQMLLLEFLQFQIS